MKRGLFAACAALGAVLAAWGKTGATAAAPPDTVPQVDLERYAGKWYEIARLPNDFQQDCAGDVSATYSLRDDGRLDVVIECQRADGQIDRAEGVARVAGEDGSNSKLEVRFAPAWLSFIPAVWGDYWIVELADDYSYAVVGHPERTYLWILSRTPRMDADLYQRLLGRIERRHGYDVSRIERTAQSAR